MIDPAAVTIEKIKKAAALDCTHEEICIYAGITMAQLKTYFDSLPGLEQEVDAMRHYPTMKARETLVRALETNPEIALKYLERKKRKEFAVRTELTGEDGKDLTIQIVNYAPQDTA